MATSLEHRHDCAVVAFDGPLTWATTLELLGVLETAVRGYFYTNVEIVVSSPGGEPRALLHLLAALDVWREKGVHVRTRVIFLAASAAAILVCSGDERMAEPGAILQFHHVRAIDTGPVSARDSAELHRSLKTVDEGLIRILVDRSVRDRTRTEPPRFAASTSDTRVLEHLHAGLNLSAKRRKPSGARALARAVGRAVDKAARANDRTTLALIYGRLAELDRPISASLAFTLRLIDRIGPSETEAEERRLGDFAGLTIPEWSALHPPDGHVPREVLTRHTLVLGETGAGKTASAILPITAALARAPRDAVGTALIIDPKKELASALEAIAPDRLRHIDTGSAVIDLMAGPRWRVAEELAAGRWYSAATLILYRVASLVHGNPARVLLNRGTTRDEFFDREGTELALCVLSLVLMVTSPQAPPPADWLGVDFDAIDLMSELVARARGTDRERGPNALALLAWVLDGRLMTYPQRDGTVRVGESRPVWLFTRIAEAALEVWGRKPGEGRDVLKRVIGYWDEIACIDRQYAGVRATARVLCTDFAAPAISRTLYFGFEPGYIGSVSETLDFTRAVGPQGGPLVVFQPTRDGLDVLVAMALKAVFFEAVLDNEERARSGGDLPLVAYVSDEFQRFITSDPVHGESTFLDTCRSFGALCVLATQSLAALEHALAHGGGSDTQNETSIAILFNNTGSKFFFRTTDPTTSERLHQLCPIRPGMPAVTKVRPLSSLSPGECYAVLSDGRFERRKLSQFQLPSPDLSRSREGRER